MVVNKGILWVGGVLFVFGSVLFAVSLFEFPQNNTPAPSREDLENSPVQSQISSPVPIIAAFPKGAVKVEIYSDYTCPYCKSFWTKTIKPLRERYAKKSVSFSLRHFPVVSGGIAETVAKYAICASEQKDFWEVSDALFAKESLSKDAFLDISKALQIDQLKIDACMLRPDIAEKIQKDSAEGKEKGVRGPPTTFLNGEKFEGNLPIENLDLEIFTRLKR